jgi:uncharacterized protein (TIRG00374 family)
MKQPSTKRSQLIALGRIVFAAVALFFVIHSVQFGDVLTKNEKSYPIVSQNDASYTIEDESGKPIQIRRSDPEYKFRIGAVSLAKSIRITPTILGVVFFAAVPILLAFRWRWLLKVQGVDIPLWPVIQLTYAGLFLNFFLIGTTGGDLVKAYWVGKFSPKRAEAFVSVFVDRFIGLVVLILLSAVLVVFMWRDPQVAKISRGVGVLVIGTAMAILVLFSRHIRRLIRFDRWKNKLPFHELIDRIDQSLLAYRQSPKILFQAAMATVALQVLGSIASYFLGSAIFIDATLWYYLLYVPLAFLIGSIPVSIFWGLGLLEGAYVAFFAGSGFASVTQAAMLAMAVRLMQLFWALPGSVFLATGIGHIANLPVNENEQERSAHE